MKCSGASIGLALLALLMTVLPLRADDTTTGPSTAASTQPTTAVERGGKAVVIPMHGTVDDYNRDSLIRRIGRARQLGADTIILDVNSYGGLVTAGLDISRFLKQQQNLHIIAFVGDKAISAGVMIALAADEIVMAPHSVMGDSAPIAVSATGGMDTLGETERAKAESPILEDFYDSALRNGYDPLLTQSMVSVGMTVHWVENKETGKRRFVDAKELEILTKGDDAEWKIVEGVRDPVDGPNTLLTVNSDLAVKLGLAKGLANSPEDLAGQRGLTIIADLAPSFGEKLVDLLNGAAVRGILITLFFGSLYIALHTPGHGGAEAIALITLGTIIGVPLLTGYAQWWEALAMLLGLVLVALEIFVIPGFGVVGITGIILFFAGLIMTFVGTEPSGMPGWLPTLSGTWDALRNGLFAVAIAMAVSLVSWVWLSRYLPKLPYFSRLILTTTAGGTAAIVNDPTVATDGPVVGDHGKAISDLRPGGQVRLERDGRIISVVSENGYLNIGTAVIVRELSGNRVLVRSREA